MPYEKMDEETLNSRMKKIELLLLDVDGVLTDGGIIYHDDGSETKVFNAKDGLGMRLLRDGGVEIGIVTGRDSKAVRHRCENLGIQLVFTGIRDKGELLAKIEDETGISAENMAFVGDDLFDMPIMKRVGFSFAVADASDPTREHADAVTRAKGGKGAVREVCEMILKAKGLWEKVTSRFMT